MASGSYREPTRNMTARVTDGRSGSSIVINRAPLASVSKRNGGELRGTESVYRRNSGRTRFTKFYTVTIWVPSYGLS